MTTLFCDTETTGLADRCDVWEIGLIVRPDTGPDAEYSWLIRPYLSDAEPTGLRIGRFYERMGDLIRFTVGSAKAVVHPDPVKRSLGTTADVVAGDVARLLDGAVIVGAVPDFDTRHLSRFLREHDQAGTWHYHLVDVETFAAGSLHLAPPWDFDALLGHFGLKYDEADRHTALGDARMVRDLFDAVLADGGAP